MRFYSNLIINDNLLKQLYSYIEKDTIPHALLFHGNEGVGKFAHAIEFANMLLSKTETKEKVFKKVKNNQHHNINYILPLPKNKSISKNDAAIKALTSKDMDNIHNQIKSKLNDPYYTISIDKANTILINSIRDIKKKINLSRFNENYNIHIILDAEKLCYPKNESANALLKILEEPHEKNLFILLTSNKSKIIDTIISRCAKFYFPNVNNKLIETFLCKQYNLDNERAKIISKICCGNIPLGIELSNNFDEKVSTLIHIIELLFGNNLEKWQKFMLKIKSKRELKYYLNLVEIFIVDIITYQKIKSTDTLKFTNFKKYILSFSQKYKSENLYELIDIIYNTKKNMLENIYFPLLNSSLYLEFQKTLHSDEIKKFNFSNYKNY